MAIEKTLIAVIYTSTFPVINKMFFSTRILTRYIIGTYCHEVAAAGGLYRWVGTSDRKLPTNYQPLNANGQNFISIQFSSIVILSDLYY